MSLMTFGVVFVLLVVGAFGFMLVYAPSISGAYDGFAQDRPAGATGPILLTLAETDGSLAGELTLPPTMGQGGGTLSGRMKDGRMSFVTTDGTGQKMTWVASISPKSLSGFYWWGDVDEISRMEVTPLGAWSASMRR